jgi:glycosyltransferase involved in cell wall biosynthesis
MKISGLIMTKNEERCIERCIKSIKPIVDELIVVDTGSTDNTVKIAESLGAAVHHITWQNSFSDARNAAMEYATGEWIVFIDADEYFRKGDERKVRPLLERMRKVKPKEYMRTCRIFLERWDYRAERFAPGSPEHPENSEQPLPRNWFEITSNARILHKGNRFAYVGTVHESYTHKDGSDPLDYYDPNNDIVLYHDGYSDTLFQSKVERNAELLKEELHTAQGMRRALVLNYLGSTYFTLNQPAEALKYFEEFVENPNVTYQNAMQGHIFYIHVLEKLGTDEQGMLKACDKVIGNWPGHPTPLLLRAFQNYRFRRFSDCERDLRETFEKKKSFNFGLEWEISRLEKLYTSAYMIAGDICTARGAADSAYEFYFESCRDALDRRKMAGEAVDFMFVPTDPKLSETPFDKMLISSRYADEQAIIRDLQALIENEADLDLLLGKLRLFRADIVYLTFFDRWNRVHPQQGLHFFMAMTIIGEYGLAVDGLLKRYSSTGEEVYLHPALFAASLGGTAFLQKFKQQAPDAFRGAASALLGEPAELNDAHLPILLKLMENVLAAVPEHEIRKKTEELLTGAYGYEGLFHLGKILSTRLFFSEAGRCYRKVIETAPPEVDRLDAAGALMEMDVASRDFTNFENDMVLSLSCGYSPSLVRQSLIWALGLSDDLQWTGRMAAWLPRIENWEKLYLQNIVPQDKEDRLALEELFKALGVTGSAVSVAVRALLQARFEGRDDFIPEKETADLLAEIRAANTPKPIMTHFSTNNEAPAIVAPAVQMKAEKI